MGARSRQRECGRLAQCRSHIDYLFPVIATENQAVFAADKVLAKDRGRFIDPSAEGIVFERYRAAARREGDARQTVLEIPGVGRCACRIRLGECITLGIVCFSPTLASF